MGCIQWDQRQKAASGEPQAYWNGTNLSQYSKDFNLNIKALTVDLNNDLWIFKWYISQVGFFNPLTWLSLFLLSKWSALRWLKEKPRQRPTLKRGWAWLRKWTQHRKRRRKRNSGSRYQRGHKIAVGDWKNNNFELDSSSAVMTWFFSLAEHNRHFEHAGGPVWEWSWVPLGSNTKKERRQGGRNFRFSIFFPPLSLFMILVLCKHTLLEISSCCPAVLIYRMPFVFVFRSRTALRS